MSRSKPLDGMPLPFETGTFADEEGPFYKNPGHHLPIQVSPYPDELLSSWLVRMAWMNAEKLHTFKRRFWKFPGSPWGRNIDLIFPSGVLHALSQLTGRPGEEIEAHRLTAFTGILFEKPGTGGIAHGLLSSLSRGRQVKGYALQFCPACLREQTSPYFRLTWRISYVTVCPIHNCVLHESCPDCRRPIVIHLADAGQLLLPVRAPTSFCSYCGADWRQSRPATTLLDDDLLSWLKDLAIGVSNKWVLHNQQPIWALSYYSGLNFLLAHLLADRPNKRLHQIVASTMGLLDLPPNSKSPQYTFSTLRLADRIYILRLLHWLLQEWPDRLIWALRTAKLHYSYLKNYGGRLIPFWIDQHLYLLKDHKHMPISQQEKASVRAYLEKRHWPANPNQVNRWLGRWYVGTQNNDPW
ncbi:TniQ family protein [Aquitalea sp.]|uniref:TniQ family protein n=1 Tax=Aquitalea sp. TaxID=1872623 RepID=UPI00258DCE20|nr:TniQ family protein [Aquitalea sp.]